MGGASLERRYLSKALNRWWHLLCIFPLGIFNMALLWNGNKMAVPVSVEGRHCKVLILTELLFELICCNTGVSCINNKFLWLSKTLKKSSVLPVSIEVIKCLGKSWSICMWKLTFYLHFCYVKINSNQNSIQDEINSNLKSKNAWHHSVQNILSSSWLSKNLKNKICRTIILPVLYGCTIWSLTLREDVGWGCLRIGCWGEYLVLVGMR